MLGRNALTLIGAAAMALASAPVSAANIDLSTWSEQGNPANGTWTVAPGGGSVTQSINGDPTFFVSPQTFINTTFEGQFRVNGTSDDDYIGFVFGYKSPLAANGDAVNDYSFFLFDWKQTNQGDPLGTATEGFNLSRVSGVVNGFSPFWAHDAATAPDADFDTIATDYGSTRGWADATTYDFTLLYQTNRIKITIAGGTEDFATEQTIFDISPGDAGLTEFETGLFGFYNYSQANVTYQGFTEEVTLPDDPGPGPIPEPATLALFGVGLAGLGLVRRRRRAA